MAPYLGNRVDPNDGNQVDPIIGNWVDPLGGNFAGVRDDRSHAIRGHDQRHEYGRHNAGIETE